MYKMRIAVLMGGKSSEYDVSLKTGKNVIDCLDKEKYSVLPILITKANNWQIDGKETTPTKALKGIKVVFIAMHGQYGEDGSIQGVLEMLDVPYTGSGIMASALSMNKAKARSLFRLNGLLTPSNTIINKKTWYEHPEIIKDIANNYMLPCVIKPNSAGSSVGVTIVRELRDFITSLENALQYAPEAIIEEYLQGKEVTCGVVENFNGKEIAALPVTEIIPPNGHFFDAEAKYNGQTQEITPARLDDKLNGKVQKNAIAAHQILGCRGYSRTDMIIQNEKIYVLEINTLPGLTSQSILPQQAKAVGVSFQQLVEHLINTASTDHSS